LQRESNAMLPALRAKVENLEVVIQHLNSRLEKAPGPDIIAFYENQLKDRDVNIAALTRRVEQAVKVFTA
jgi:hypothetical protein